ncbi:MAG: hypothetical protein MI784_10920 [Cytophagales bacterium]|nr:hypothetical protein [Cytophagales bacterium]
MKTRITSFFYWVVSVFLLAVFSCEEPDQGGPGINYSEDPSIVDNTNTSTPVSTGQSMTFSAVLKAPAGIKQAIFSVLGRDQIFDNQTTGTDGTMLSIEEKVFIPWTQDGGEYDYSFTLETTNNKKIQVSGTFNIVQSIYGVVNTPSDTAYYRPNELVSFNATVYSTSAVSDATMQFNNTSYAFSDFQSLAENLYSVSGELRIPFAISSGTYPLRLTVRNTGGQEGIVEGRFNIDDRLFVVGGSTRIGWDPEQAISMPYIPGEGVHRLGTLLKSGESGFKFIGQLNGYQPLNWGLGSTSFSLLLGSSANLPSPAATGYYTITVDISNLSYSLSLAREVAQISAMYVYGSATQAGEEPADAIRLTNLGGGEFSANIQLGNSGNFMFFEDRSSIDNYYWGKGESLEQLKWKGDPIPAPAEAGIYRVSLDLNNGTYSVALNPN